MSLDFINLSFISLKQNSHLQIDPTSEKLMNLLLVFQHNFYPEKSQYILEAIQQNTKELRTDLNTFILKHAKEFPQLHKIKSFLSSLPDGHFFIIIKGTIEDTNNFLQYFSYLKQHHEKHGIKVERSVDTLDWGILLNLYNISMFGHQRASIGARDKYQRICRFCSGRQGETNKFYEKVTFEKKAHAFSEALGNKQVILYEECDACNERFGSSTGIEFSLIAILKMFRAIHGLKGKSGIKAVDGENFTLKTDGTSITIDYNGSIPEELDLENINLELVLKDRYIPQDVYRCLCKFVLSVIASKDIKFFSKTVEWINNEFNASKLPKVAILQDSSFFTSHPLLLFFQRKNENDNLPFMIGEFHYADIIYVFITPFSSKDKQSFVEQEDFDLFWKDFNQVRADKNWGWIDFSSNERLPIISNFNFK